MTIPYNHIRGFVIGRKAQVIRVPVLDIAAARVIDKAWFTLKQNVTDADGDALIAKEITTVADLNAGVIDTDPTLANAVRLTFNLMPADWTTAGIVEGTFYFYDITVREADETTFLNPEEYTVELGDFMGLGPILVDPV